MEVKRLLANLGSLSALCCLLMGVAMADEQRKSELPSVTMLETIDVLAASFDRHQGSPRLVLLLSPI